MSPVLRRYGGCRLSGEENEYFRRTTANGKEDEEQGGAVAAIIGVRGVDGKRWEFHIPRRNMKISLDNGRLHYLSTTYCT